jgi:hypothetical protein
MEKSMSKVFKYLTFLLCTMFFQGCATDYSRLREANRMNLPRLSLGMTLAQVNAVMGSEIVDGFGGKIGNPYKHEIVSGVDKSDYEVYYYYTEHVGNKDWTSGMTPVIFKNGKLEGVGWSAFAKNNLARPQSIFFNETLSVEPPVITLEKNTKGTSLTNTSDISEPSLKPKENSYLDDELIKAERGDATAQDSLGQDFSLKQSYSQAAYWYRKAAEQGLASAQDSLGFMYQKGEGVPKNHLQAYDWYSKAALQNSISAKIHLAELFESYLYRRDAAGHIIEDKEAFENAVFWYRDAANQGLSSKEISKDYDLNHFAERLSKYPPAKPGALCCEPLKAV